MKVLVLNAGSSSIKYQIFELKSFLMIACGILNRMGAPKSRLRHKWVRKEDTYEETVDERNIEDYREGLEWIISTSERTGTLESVDNIFGIGHRVVHGGEAFEDPAVIDARVIEAIRNMVPLAPIHNPENLELIEVAVEHYPRVPQVAVFDTSFHQTMPGHSYLYALPYSLYGDCHVRKYGFHGTSHFYVAKQVASYLGRPLKELNLITLHLGNGASATAIKEGKSVDTSMGMTPLEGLMMGTRCGNIDPSILFYLSRTAGMSIEEMETLVNEGSGLKGICGSNDMREIEYLAKKGEPLARLAIEMFCYRIKKYIGSYFAVLGSIDALVFTGGIGENSCLIRKLSCNALARLGICVDAEKNAVVSGTLREIQKDGEGVKIIVVPANEELEIAMQTVETIRRSSRPA